MRILIHTLARPAFFRPEVGAIPVLRLAAHPALEDLTGRFFDRCDVVPDSADYTLAQAFWSACEQMIADDGDVRPEFLRIPQLFSPG
jgi:hypothetical protein